MPGWGDILAEIQAEQIRIQQVQAQNPNDPAGRASAPNIVRHKYLKELSDYTNRNTIVYASAWLQKSQVPADFIVIHPSDMDGFLEVVKASDTKKDLDLILHSPGGSPAAAEQIINYLRQKFTRIRVVVPHMAMSAATMMACGANSICMARHSTLGPTDPQFTIRTNTGEIRSIPAHALLSDFDSAQSAKEKGGYAAWAGMIGQYPPGIVSQCNMAIQLTTDLVKDWLARYMFSDQPDAQNKATKLSTFLAHNGHFVHERPLMRDQLKAEGFVIEDMEDDDKFQDLVMSVYHATTHTLGGTNTVKIIECNAGRGYYRQV